MIDCDLVIDKAGQLHDPVMPVARTDGVAIGELESLASGPKQRLKAVPPGNVSPEADGAGRDHFNQRQRRTIQKTVSNAISKKWRSA